MIGASENMGRVWVRVSAEDGRSARGCDKPTLRQIEINATNLKYVAPDLPP